ncbi:MAG: 1-acyl-sn-glycerol-3-phosphate acyltransferase [Saprospiraceae bacterium]|nr:1-acyl-sn-glycerol-3-phosphate acyltransferase [Saprospiraceae bacterium]
MAIFLGAYSILSSFLFKNTVDRAFALRRLYVRYACFVMGIIIEKEGNPTVKPAVYVSNHRSLSDPLITSPFLNAFIIAKAEVENIPLISTGAKLTGILFVERESKDSRSAVREKMVETLEEGQNVLVYPEGTVNHLKTPLPYRPGTFKTAAKMGLPVIPIVLEYKHEKDLWYNRQMVSHFFHQFGWPLTKAKLAFGPPISNTDGELLKKEVEVWTINKINEMHSNWKSVFSNQ